MIEHSLDTAHSILHVRHSPPSSRKTSSSRENGRPLNIEATGDRAGLIIEIRAFPGWDSPTTMAAHFRFVRDHHRRVKKVAIAG